MPKDGLVEIVMDTCVSPSTVAVETPVAAKPSLWSRFKGWLNSNGLYMVLGGPISMLVGMALTFVPVAAVAVVGAVLYVGGWFAGMLGFTGVLVGLLN